MITQLGFILVDTEVASFQVRMTAACASLPDRVGIPAVPAVLPKPE